MKVEAKKKLSELPITWKEAYTDRTMFLKEQYEDVIGTGSYFRWEGRNSDTGDEYYVVVSPANIHKPKALFFAGVRKLPSDYAAYGEYFSEIREALKYAHETWGTPMPSDMRYYDASDLKGLKARINEWKKDKAAYNEHDFIKEAMARRVGDENWAHREGYLWLNLKNILARQNPDWGLFEKTKKDEQAFTKPGDATPIELAMNHAIAEKNHWTGEMMKKYGLQDPVFYQMWIVHRPEAGTQASYIFSIAPHSSYLRDENGLPITTVGIFKRAISTVTEEQVHAKRAEFLAKIRDLYPWMKKAGIDFTDEDFVTAPLIGQSKGTIRLSEQGREKWTEAILDWYRNTVEVTTTDGNTFLFNKAGVGKLKSKGINVKSIKDLLTPSLEESIKKNPTGGWKDELKSLSKKYVEQWMDAYNKVKGNAIKAGYKGTNIDKSKEVAAFLDTTPKPPIYNDDIMKMQVGSIASSPIYFKPAYLLKKKSYFEKPELDGKDTLSLINVKGLEAGDEVSLVSKVFVHDEVTNKRVLYSDGRPKRTTIETPIGKIIEVNTETNTIKLDNPVATPTGQDGLNPFSISIIKASGDKKKLEYGYDSIFDAYNALRINVSPQLELPEFTQNVTSSYLMECRNRKAQGLPPPELQTDILKNHEENKVIEQMKVDSASPSATVEPLTEIVPEAEENLGREQPVSPTAKPVSPAVSEDMDDFEMGEPIPQRIENIKEQPEKTTIEIGEEDESVFSDTILKLVKLAENYDRDGEVENAEEIHRILRKYRDKI